MGGERGVWIETPTEEEEDEDEEEEEEVLEEDGIWKSELLGEFGLGECPPPPLTVVRREPIPPPPLAPPLAPPEEEELRIAFAIHSTTNLVLSVEFLITAISSNALCWLDSRDWIWAFCA